MQIGHAGKNKGSNDTENLGGPAGLFVYPKTNELFVADGYFNHRVIVFDADTGAYKRHWGAYGKKPDDSIKFPPRAQLVAGPASAQFNNPVHAVRGVERRSRLRRRPDQQSAAGLQAGRNVRQGGVRSRRTPSRRRHGARLRRLAGQGAEVSLSSSMAPTRRSASESPDARDRVDRSADTPGTMRGSSSTRTASLRDSKGNLFIGEVNNGQRYYRYAFKGMAAAPSTR